jgi:hypothetical protein
LPKTKAHSGSVPTQKNKSLVTTEGLFYSAYWCLAESKLQMGIDIFLLHTSCFEERINVLGAEEALLFAAATILLSFVTWSQGDQMSR